MEHFIDKFLPDYVFTKKFDQYLFLYYPEFFGIAEKFIEVYVSVLKKQEINKFVVSEIISSDEIDTIKEYDVHSKTPKEIYSDLFSSSESGMVGMIYMIDAVRRSYFTVASNIICIYFERDLDAVIIGCSDQIASEFLEKKEELDILSLNDFLAYFDIIYKRDADKPWYTDIKTKMRENYSWR